MHIITDMTKEQQMVEGLEYVAFMEHAIVKAAATSMGLIKPGMDCNERAELLLAYGKQLATDYEGCCDVEALTGMHGMTRFFYADHEEHMALDLVTGEEVYQ